jgi:CRISPR-associated protein Cmr1
MMKSIEFKCELITPMFMYGAVDTPELRAPSIKGLLRYWWRAINGHLSLENIKNTEGVLFGNTERKSPFSMRIIQKEPLRFKLEVVLPHKGGSFPKQAIQVGQRFDIVFYCKNELIAELINNLFPLCCVLGGFGGRSRRGFGGIKIINGNYPITLDTILQLLNAIVPQKFILQGNALHYLATQKAEYPYIEKIEIGRPHPHLLRKIGQATHDVNREVGIHRYRISIGAANPRFSSSIYANVIETRLGLQPVVVTLHTPNVDRQIVQIQEQLKLKILI